MTDQYFSGLFDGEGSAGVYLTTKRRYKGELKNRRDGQPHRLWVPRLQLKMCDSGPVLGMQWHFGGWAGSGGITRSGKAVYAWAASHRTAEEIAKRLIVHSLNDSKRGSLQKVIDYYVEYDVREVRS